MVWIFVIGLPLFVVVACIWFVFLLGENQDSTVRDDWYMDGKDCYMQMCPKTNWHDLGLTGQMMISNQAVNFKLRRPPVISLKHLINWQWRFPIPPKSKKTVTLLSNG